MKNRPAKFKFWFTFGLAVLLFSCLTLQAPLMAYSMGNMDCETEMMCGACGCVADTLSISVFSDYSVAQLENEEDPPKTYISHEPRIHPPR